MDKTENLLQGIETVLAIANEVVNEISRLKALEDEFIMVKEQLFLSQFTKSERAIFELAIDGLTTRQMMKWLYKEEGTIKKQRQSILEKLNVSSIKEAVQLYEKIAQESHRKFNFNALHSAEKMFVI
jgi:DNA-binding NarL/FixJ family response regulator